MGYSTCCGAYTDMEEMGICPDCRDHCDFEEEEEEEEEIKKDEEEQNQVDETLLREAEEKLHNQ